jgi:hypothetical protein
MTTEHPQLNIRLSEEQEEILEAAAWVKRSTRTELARAVVLPMIEGFAKEAAVQSALSARRTEDNRAGGAVTSIHAKKKRGKSE